MRTPATDPVTFLEWDIPPDVPFLANIIRWLPEYVKRTDMKTRGRVVGRLKVNNCRGEFHSETHRGSTVFGEIFTRNTSLLRRDVLGITAISTDCLPTFRLQAPDP